MGDYTMKAVYSEIDVVYKDAIYALKGDFNQRTFLLNVTGLLNSNLYAYFNLMLGSDLGIEREQRHMGEILTFPFVYDDAIATQTETIQTALTVEDFTFIPNADEEIENLNRLILEAFNIANNPFVDYALNVQIPQLTNNLSSKAFKKADSQQLSIYARKFIVALSEVYGISGKFVSANIFPCIAKNYSAVEIILHDSKPSVEVEIIDGTDPSNATLTRFSTHKINDMFYDVKDVIHFEADSFYIIKASHYKNWHTAIAEIDLADVIDQILSSDGGND